MRFSHYIEAMDKRPFLGQALEEFPKGEHNILILADALEDDGDIKTAEVIRNLINRRDSKNKDWAVPYIEQARKILKKHKVYFTSDRVGISVERKREGPHHPMVRNTYREDYFWHGNVIVKRGSLSGAWNTEVVNINDIKEPRIIKGLAIAAASFMVHSQNAPHGLEDFYNARRKLSKEGKGQLTTDSELRYALRAFLIHFGEIELMVQRANASSRTNHRDLYHIEQSLSNRGTGYAWELPMTLQILQRFVAANGKTPFLQRLGARIFRMLNLIPNNVNADERFTNQLRDIAELIR